MRRFAFFVLLITIAALPAYSEEVVTGIQNGTSGGKFNANNKPYGLYAYVCGEPYQRYRAGRYYPSWWY